MFHNRPCGCKGLRSCLICEKEHGAWKAGKTITDDDKKASYVYCPLCDLAWPGWDMSVWKQHPLHQGESVKFEGVKVLLDFISEEEESSLLEKLDEVPWDVSQSGRLKQNYGPKCNFKKKKAKVDGFVGYPLFTKYLQDRFESCDLLKDFQTVEQCSLDYTNDRGSSIDFHIDDCWIWGERIPTISLMSDSVLTLSRYQGSPTKYNLPDVQSYPTRVDEDLSIRGVEDMNKFYGEGLQSSYNFPSDESAALPSIVRLPMPRRSLLLLYGTSRYSYEHAVLREDIDKRRVCVTYRELTPTFLSQGHSRQIGAQILAEAKKFKDHKEMYNLNNVGQG